MKISNLDLIKHNLINKEEFVNIIDSILVSAALFDQKLKIDESFVHVSFSIDVNQFMTKTLIFETNGMKDKKIVRVYLKEWNFGYLSKIIRSSNLLIYKNGKMSKPIEEFIGLFKERKNNEN